ncbi:MAG: hypothetical protein RSE29_13320 [Leclercia sp.]
MSRMTRQTPGSDVLEVRAARTENTPGSGFAAPGLAARTAGQPRHYAL